MLDEHTRDGDSPQQGILSAADRAEDALSRRPDEYDVQVRMRRIMTTWDKCLARKEEIDVRELWRELAEIRFAAVKIGNIPWEISSSEIVETFSRLMPLKKLHIHIPIDRATGKTKPEMFIEMSTSKDALRFANHYNRSILKGRAISVTSVSLDEVVLAHFPTLADGDREFLSQDEVASLVNICRNYKAHFSRKCAERPFEHVLSILRLAPWYLMGERMCGRIFFMVSGASEALLDHLARHQNHHPQARQQLPTHFSNKDIFVGLYNPNAPTISMADFELAGNSSNLDSSRLGHSLDLSATGTNQHLPTLAPGTPQTPLAWPPSSWAAAVAAPSANTNAPSGGGGASHLGRELLGRLVGASQTFPAFSAPQRMALRKMVVEQPNKILDRQKKENRPRFGGPILLQAETKMGSGVNSLNDTPPPGPFATSVSLSHSPTSSASSIKENRHIHGPRVRRPSLDAILKEHHNDKKGERSASVNQMMRDVFDKIMLSTDD